MLPVSDADFHANRMRELQEEYRKAVDEYGLGSHHANYAYREMANYSEKHGTPIKLRDLP